MSKPVPGGIAQDRLLSIIERVERLQEEKKALQEQIKDVFAEAKSAGFDVKAVRAMIRERAMDEGDRTNWLLLLDTYRRALGMAGEEELAAARALAALGDVSVTLCRSAPGQDDAAEDEVTVFSEEDLEEARAKGRVARDLGRSKLSNPYPWIAGDPRRGAWDEGWGPPHG